MPSEREILEQFRLTPEGQKLLDTISYAEGTRRQKPEESYRVMFGGGLAPDLTRHPDKVIRGDGIASAAAGRYQFMPNTWETQASRLGLQGFGPVEQDIAALALARNRLMPLGGLAALQREGLSPRVAAALAPEWASFPTESGQSFYGQPVKPLSELQQIYGAAAGNQPVAPAQTTSPVGADVTIESFDFNKRLKDTISKEVLSSAFAGVGGDTNSMALAQLLSTASDMEAADDESIQSQGTTLKSKALSQFLNSGPDTLNPSSLISSVMRLKGEEQDYYNRAQRIQKTLADIQGQQSAQSVMQNQQSGARFGQGTAQATGDSIRYLNATKPSFDPGEPGIDFSIEGGKRGAVFQSPYRAEVLKVVSDQNWENNLEKTGGGQRGYGNYVELRFTDPKTGYKFDSLLAHFDKVNPDLKPGAVISAGTPLGTQGRTGSTTGPHVSWDFFDAGSNQASAKTLQYRQQIADRIAAGLPVF